MNLPSAAISAGAQKIFVKWTDKYRMNELNGALVRVLGQPQFQCEDMSTSCNGKENNIKWIRTSSSMTESFPIPFLKLSERIFMRHSIQKICL